jgi:hypothetical protein
MARLIRQGNHASLIRVILTSRRGGFSLSYFLSTLSAIKPPKALVDLGSGPPHRGKRGAAQFKVTRLDRLARSTHDLLDTLAQIAGKGAGFRSLGAAWANTTTPHGRLMRSASNVRTHCAHSSP